jgi:hypothetical protein
MLNFLERRGLAIDVREWFDQKTPRPAVSRNWVRSLVKKRLVHDDARAERRLVWLGRPPHQEATGKRVRLVLPGKGIDAAVLLPSAQAQWVLDLIGMASPRKGRSIPYPLLREAEAGFPGGAQEFERFLEAPSWRRMRSAGLLLV